MRRIAPLFLLLTALGSAGLRAQDLEPTEQRAWDEFASAMELGDSREMETACRKNRVQMQSIFNKFEWALQTNDGVDLWTKYKALARALDGESNSNEFTKRQEVVEKLSPKEREQRGEIWNQYNDANLKLQDAQKERDPSKIDLILNEMQRLSGEAAKVNDVHLQCFCLADIANNQAKNEQLADAAAIYVQIDKLMTDAGYKGMRFHAQVRAEIERLKAAGVDPNAKPDAGGKEGGSEGGSNTSSSWSKDEAGQKWSDPIPLALKVDEKLPWGKINTPSFRNSEDPFLWSGFTLEGKGPVPFDDSFKPMGIELKISREGAAKVLLAEGDKKPHDIKAIEKPNLVRVEHEFVDGWTKQPVKQEYAFLVATGGSNEQLFGLAVNAGPSETNYPIRYAPACYLKGKVLGLDVTIFDDNVSGKFGDSFRVSLPTNSHKPAMNFADAMIIGNGTVAGPFTEYLDVNGDFYRLKVSGDDEAYGMTVRKLAIDTGTVKLDFAGKLKPEAVVIEELKNFVGAFFNVSAKPVRVPVGEYKLSYGILRMGKGKQQKICLMAPSGGMASFQVKKGEEHVISLGAPYRFEFDKDTQGNGDVKIVGKSVTVVGRGEEMYFHFYDDPPIPEKVTLRIDGKVVGKPLPMKKAVFEDFRTDQLCVWQPLDLMLPANGAKGSVEIDMELKKHSMLDGPISTKNANKK